MIKRIFDFGVATVGLVLTMPFWALIALCIKLDSPGPVLFRQTRLGRKGKPFICYKFRTMIDHGDNAEHRAYMRQLIRGQAPKHYEPRTDTYVYRLIDDQRITRFGRFLRTNSLDELPQLINVLKGDMSLVGPRPPVPYEVEIYQAWHLRRLDALPGLTGLWQVRGRGLVSFDEMVRMDLDYITRQSFWLDLRILCLTPRAVIMKKGAG
jgi:lipopolysaccharide/colanic/teichoic acid biosynthesis glycosyltransferase